MNPMVDGALSLQAWHKQEADPILDKLLHEIECFVTLLKPFDINLAIDSPKARIAWAVLPVAAKAQILHGFSQYHNNCRELVISGVSLRDNYAFLAHSMKRANLFAIEDIRRLLTQDNIVEIYNLEHIQIFRSINFFDYCNYSVLDLLAREWFDLYERLSSITECVMHEVLEPIKTGKVRKLTVPLHVLKERDSNPRGVFHFDFQYCFPLYSAPGVPGGYLLTENVTELDLLAPSDKKLAFLR